MKAVVYEAPREFTVRNVDDPRPAADELLIRVERTGICGTDHHLHEGEFDAVYPLTPGHEIVGTVAEIGVGVSTDLVIGERIVVDNRIGCLSCAACRRGQTNLCRRAVRLGVTAPGGFAELVVVPAYKCLSVEGLTLDQAALVEPTSCAVHAIDTLTIRTGSVALVFGAGPAGLIVSQVLRAAGVAQVTVAAPTRFKLDIAEALGADRTITIERGSIAANDEQLRGVAPDGFDLIVDTTGSPGVVEGAVPYLADGGTLLMYGMSDPDQVLRLDPFQIFRRELTIKGTFSQAFSFSRAIEMVRSGRVRPDGILSHSFPLDEFGAALDASRYDRSCIKAVIDI